MTIRCPVCDEGRTDLAAIKTHNILCAEFGERSPRNPPDGAGIVVEGDAARRAVRGDGVAARNRTGTPLSEARDFKSLVSTYFTTLAIIE